MTKATQKKLLQAIETCKGMLASTGWSAASWFPVQQQMNRLQKLLPEDASSVTEIITSLQQALQALPKKMDTDTAQETRELVSDLLVAAADRIASLPVKKLVVFLPYKASMWDSLESIWRAAAADKEHCETLVIPIPYCDLSADHKPLQWHVETNLFPKDVPVTSYDAVNLEELHPDAIFVHNPYDQYNRVTSVDSRYYTSHLKDLTDCLVYVPYYVSETVTGQSFCQVPGVVHADLVITQDEANKKRFERFYPLGTPPRGKFLPLGSPKFDKVRQARKEDFELPEEWKHIIGGRKILLYCTTIGDVLRHSAKVCAKMRAVFEKFRNNSEWAFWWRPHPLMKSSLQSMRPELYDEYCRLEEEYCAAGWGIFDDMSDLDCAIAYSDLYYGDRSSVMTLFASTGKPIVIQDYDYIEEMMPFDIPVWAADFASDGENLWFVEGNLNILMRYTPATGRISCMGMLPADRFMQEDAYYGIACASGKVFIFPLMGQCIYVYHVQEQKFSVIHYPLEGEYLIKFRQAFVYGKWVYCTPAEDYPYILRIDSETERVEIAADLSQVYSELGLPHAVICMASRMEDSLLLTVLHTSKVIFFNLATHICSVLDFESIRPEFQAFCPAMTEHTIFVSTEGESSGIFVIDRATGDVKRKIQTDNLFLWEMGPHRVMAYNTVGHWMQLDEEGKIVREGTASSLRLNGTMQYIDDSILGKRMGRGSYAFNMHTSSFCTFDSDGRLLSEKHLSLKNAEHLPSLMTWYRDQKVFEFPRMDLNLMLACHKSVHGDNNEKVPAGKRIYQAICQYLAVGRENWQGKQGSIS